MCGLHIVGKEHSHQAIYKFIEEAEASHRLSPFKGLPVQLRLQLLKRTPVGNELGIDKPFFEFEGT